MTIDEAITDLSIQREVKRRLGKNREASSQGLGIEALKAVIKSRTLWGLRGIDTLPGETESGKNEKH